MIRYRQLLHGSQGHSAAASWASGVATVLLLTLSSLPVAAQLSGDGDQFWHQDSAGLPDTSEAGDRFGIAVVTGDFDGDCFDDLVMGAYLEDLPGAEAAGAIHVLYGAAAGLATTANQFLHQDNIAGDSAENQDQFGFALAAGDFDGDGFDDLAVAAVAESLEISGALQAGAVHILMGSSDGLDPSTAFLLTQNSAGMLDQAEDFDFWGRELAAGDFDGDGFDDLAVGAPFESLTAPDQGAVQLIYGTAGGLTTADNQFWHQNSLGIQDVAEIGDKFGFALASGNFDGDGYDDLAVGVVNEDAEGVGLDDVGAVHTIFGSSAGLTSPDAQFWAQVPGLILGVLEEGDHFGDSVASDDFNGDGFDELAVGVPREDIEPAVGVTIADAGAVNVIYGGPDGLTSFGNQFWHQDSPGITDAAESGDRFPFSLAGGDFNGDSVGDLAIGVPFEGLAAVAEAGVVHVLHGVSASGLTASGSQHWYQDLAELEDTSEANDLFGLSLVAGSFNGDQLDDLAIGVILEDVNGSENAGAVQVLYAAVVFADGFESGDTSAWSVGQP